MAEVKKITRTSTAYVFDVEVEPAIEADPEAHVEAAPAVTRTFSWGLDIPEGQDEATYIRSCIDEIERQFAPIDAVEVPIP